MTGIYKVQRKHGVKWYAIVNYTIAGIHYQKKSPVFDTQKEARAAEIELQTWVQQVIQEAELGHTEPPTTLPEYTDTAVTEAQKRPQRLVAPTFGQVWKSTETRPKSQD